MHEGARAKGSSQSSFLCKWPFQIHVDARKGVCRKCRSAMQAMARVAENFRGRPSCCFVGWPHILLMLQSSYFGGLAVSWHHKMCEAHSSLPQPFASPARRVCWKGAHGSGCRSTEGVGAGLTSPGHEDFFSLGSLLPPTSCVLCCVVLCCVVLWCAVLCCAVLCCAVLCCVELCCVVLC